MTPVEVQVHREGDQAACHRCGLQLLLTAALPAGLRNARGQDVGGSVIMPLCGRCDADAPNAGALVTFLAVHEHITAELIGEFTDHITAWLDDLSPATVDPRLWEADYQAWLGDRTGG